jgi:hypothetical protein
MLLVVMIFSALTFSLYEVFTFIRLLLGDLKCIPGDFGIGEALSDLSAPPPPKNVIDFMFCFDRLFDLFL